MRFAALLVGVASAQYTQIAHSHFTDQACAEGKNTTLEALNTCHQQLGGRSYRLVKCDVNGQSASEQEYTDAACTNKLGQEHTWITDVCRNVGGARGSFESTCVKAVEDQANDFEAWTTRHNKFYATRTEHAKRKAIFQQNLEKAQLLNLENVQAGGDAAFGVTQFSDLSEQEFRETYLMPNYQPRDEVREPVQVENVLADVDWRLNGTVLTKIKDQGQCGSCWAFSAVSAIESYGVINGGYPLEELSPQQINSCDKTDGGCNGGNTETAYRYVVSAGGIETEANYPYTSGRGVAGACKFDATKVAVKITGYTAVARGEANLEAALNKGPPSVCLAATSFQTYRGGILTVCTGAVDHCVQAIGYTANYWIVRNQWGTGWGEQGYIRIARGSNLCQIANDVTVPKF